MFEIALAALAGGVVGGLLSTWLVATRIHESQFGSDKILDQPMLQATVPAGVTPESPPAQKPAVTPALDLTKPARVLEIGRLLLVDDLGEQRAELGCSREGAFLVFLDGNNRERLRLVVAGTEGEPKLSLLDPQTPGFRIYSDASAGRPRLELGAKTLSIAGAGGIELVTLHADPEGTVDLRLADHKGNPRVLVGVGQDAAAGVIVYDRRRQARAGLSVAPDGVAALALGDAVTTKPA